MTSVASHMPTISVVIPCYRQADYLGEAIESVLGQTYPVYEIVVVDDGSPDDTERVARSYPGIQYLRQQNQGPSAARNHGLRTVRGEYVVFLDADDLLLPEHFEISLNAFRTHPEVACVIGDYRWFGAEGTWHVHDCTPCPDHYASLLRSNFIGPPHPVMFRLSILLELSGFRVDLRTFEDLELYLRVARRYRMHCHHEMVALYRRHDQQTSLNFEAMLKSGLAVLWGQRPYIRGNRNYLSAYRVGIRHTKQTWGVSLAWEMVAAAREGRLRRAAQCFAVLLRWYPEALGELLQHKMTVMLQGEKPA